MLIEPTSVSGDPVLLADGVYSDDSTLYITSSVTSLGTFNLNPSVIYCFAAVPPLCVSNTFTGYDATLHIPPASYGAYFINEYWSNFGNMFNDAVEPTMITLTETEANLSVGSVLTLTATVIPNNASLQTVTWSSSNPSVATVNGGQVTTKGVGECNIIASCLGKQVMCHVAVIDPITITLDQTSITIEQTQQITLTATIFPEGADGSNITWSTTNSSIASVENGVVTGVGVGECDIVVSYLDKHAVCHVKVVKPTITITLDKHEVRLLPNHSVTLTPSMTPLETSLSVSVSNPEVAAARLVNGVVQVVGLTEGSTMIVVSSTDGQAIPDACMVTVYTELGDVNCDGFVNIADVTNLIDYLLDNSAGSFNAANADTNCDDLVNIADVTALIDYLLAGRWPWETFYDKTFTVNGVSFKMIAVEGGTFSMGASNDDSDAYQNEKPAHEVTLSSFYIGETEVTQELWLAVLGLNPSYFSSNNDYTTNLNRPTESVSWIDCQIFIKKLNEMTGKQFRLLTEAEWEFAARGGNLSQGYKYSGSNNLNEVAWYRYNIPSQSIGTDGYGTQPVATKKPNELGIYDMSGNVWEWVQDWYSSSYYNNSPSINPSGPDSGFSRVYRGCAWDSQRVRISYRGNEESSTSNRVKGLRLALDVENSPKFRLSETIVTVSVGEYKSVDILNGNGDFSVEGGIDNITSSISDNSLFILGINEGFTTIHVTDSFTGATAVLTVIVKGANPKTEYFTVNGVSFTMIAVEGSTFLMGATAEQHSEANDNEKPAHQVTLSGFTIGETEVTQALWLAVMGSNPSYFTPANGYTEDLQRPVESVSWNDCQTFITRLNELTGKSFRLPTEAEWEYAARGGNKSNAYKYAGGDIIDEVAWCWENIPSQTDGSVGYGSQSVAAKASNELGLYDMSGNVWEWCQDGYDYNFYYGSQSINPISPATNDNRVMRGGSVFHSASLCRVSYRSFHDRTTKMFYLGLRLVL